MNFVYNDGGRKEAGYKGETGDCVCRAFAIATDMPYKEIYNMINKISKSHKSKYKSSARTGVYKQDIQKLAEALGMEWVPTMSIGTGCKVHMTEYELPEGRIVCNLSKHCAAVIDGVLNDTFDCSRDGTRCVYGYWRVVDEEI